MRRAALRRIARLIADEIQARGYDYWYGLDMPKGIGFTREIQGQSLNVSVNKLEATAEYVQIGVAVDDGGFLNALCPPAISVVVRKGVSPQKVPM